MCLIFIAIRKHPQYKLVVAANRDEFYKRSTAPAQFWTEAPDMVAGRDLEAGGTWLGMNRRGMIAMVTNFRDPRNINPDAPSRGHLVTNYLNGKSSARDYLGVVQGRAKSYNGFNLLAGTPDEFFYLSNYAEGIQRLDAGLYGISNHLLETPWPKVTRGKQKMNLVLSQKTIHPDEIFEVLYDEQPAADEKLPDTGIGLQLERALSSMFIKTAGYGTRCSTVILVDHEGKVSFTERVYNPESFDYKTSSFQFTIEQDAYIEKQ